MTETKRCTKCGEEKPLEEFYGNKHGVDGLDPMCKSCKNKFIWSRCGGVVIPRIEDGRRYHEEILEREREWRRQNREKLGERQAERQRRCREKNPEKYREAARKHYRCVKNPLCPAVGSRGAKYVIFTCEVCGKAFRRSKASFDWQYEHGHPIRFCSRACLYVSMRKDYVSPYARKIERIKKEVRA